MEKWLDREKNKSNILDWLGSATSDYLLTVSDSQEIEHIRIWLEELKGIKVAVAYLGNDSVNTGIGLLLSIVSAFDKNNFPEFNALHEKVLATDPPVIINQMMGNDINAFRTEFSSNTQEINIDKFDLTSLKIFNIDSRINELLDNFLNDLNNIDFGCEKLIVCKCKAEEKGFNELDGKFKDWFRDHFIRKIRNSGIRMIVLCELNPGSLANLFSYGQKDSLNSKLNLTDIIPVAEKYLNDKSGIFCRGIVDSENMISYTDFDYKFCREYNFRK